MKSMLMNEVYSAWKRGDTGNLKKLLDRIGTIKDNKNITDFIRCLSKNASPDVQVMKKKLNDAPLLSIVMPVYNIGPFLDASISSILGQSFSDFELIIVNDASTDNSGDVIDMWARVDKRIQAHTLAFNSLGGAGIPSNYGIHLARGKYIGLIDGDDFFTPTAFEDMINAAEQNNADVVIANFCEFFDDTRKIEIPDDQYVWGKIPLNKVFSPEDFPVVFRFSPVPWRKLYKKKFLVDNKIKFVECDYFFEDNPLHWDTLSNAKRVFALNTVCCYHRGGREGQTISGPGHKYAACYMHLNTVRHHFHTAKNQIHKPFWLELIDRLYRYEWIYKKQEDEFISKLLMKKYAQLVRRILESSKISMAEISAIRPDIAERVVTRDKLLPTADLSIVIPFYNCTNFIKDSLKQFEKFKKLNYEIIIINDGSTDDSPSICDDICKKNPRFIYLSQGNKGAGRARNLGIPLCTGRYTYFFDMDDAVDVHELESIVAYATKNDHDLVFFRYALEHYDAKKMSGMHQKDSLLWDKLLASKDPQSILKTCAQFINFPWNRVIKTNLLHDENIFFGHTPVHNDIQFHWHSLCASRNIGIYNKKAYTHRIFKKGNQLTNINDRRRFSIFDALTATQRNIAKYDSFDTLYDVWLKFASDVTVWASSILPQELRSEFDKKSKQIMLQLKHSTK